MDVLPQVQALLVHRRLGCNNSAGGKRFSLLVLDVSDKDNKFDNLATLGFNSGFRNLRRSSRGSKKRPRLPRLSSNFL
jgi:hypothetical protein